MSHANEDHGIDINGGELSVNDSVRINVKTTGKFSFFFKRKKSVQ